MNKTVIIAPGHGGFDPGAVNSTFGYRESDCNLAISLKLRELLVLQGLNVLMTRTTDTACGGATNVNDDVNNQINRINTSGADFAISVHLNSFGDKSVGGTETLYSDFKGKDRKVYAEVIQRHLVAAMGLRDRGAKLTNSGVGVIKHTTVPTVLAEVCFLSNDDECLWGVLPERQAVVALGLCKGVMECLGLEYKEQEKEMVKYKTYNDLPDWGKPAVQAAMGKRGIDGRAVLQGDGEGGIDLSEDLLRVIVMMYRAGVL